MASNKVQEFKNPGDKQIQELGNRMAEALVHHHFLEFAVLVCHGKV